MNVAVWDTYVTRTDGMVMNFDIIVPETMTDKEIIYGYGRAYLNSSEMPDYPLSASRCSFCHIEQATLQMMEEIKEKGYHILEIRNCR